MITRAGRETLSLYRTTTRVVYVVVQGTHRGFTFYNIHPHQFRLRHRPRILVITNTSPLNERVVLVWIVHHPAITSHGFCGIEFGIHSKVTRHASVDVLPALTPHSCLSSLAHQKPTVLHIDSVGVCNNLPALSHTPRFLVEVPVDIDTLVIVYAGHASTLYVSPVSVQSHVMD